MKVRCEIELDLQSGNYEMRVRNLSQPGERMDYMQIQQALRRVLDDVTERRLTPQQRRAVGK
jgi:hypothetical protein